MHWLTKLFVAALALHVCVQVWLAWRQCRAVQRRRGEVPLVFTHEASAASQAKASDYTIAKQRLTIWHTVFEAVVLLWLTLGGGLDRFSGLAANVTRQSLLQGTLYVLLVMGFLALAVELTGCQRTIADRPQSPSAVRYIDQLMVQPG